MTTKWSRFFDPTFFRFILVGVVNTLVGYEPTDVGYWISSAANYVVGSIVSYFLNKHFTFRNREKGARVVIRFVVNISVCYLLAYGLAKPSISWMLGGLGISAQLQGNLTMLAGSCLFVVLNYLGQRFFAFHSR